MIKLNKNDIECENCDYWYKKAKEYENDYMHFKNKLFKIWLIAIGVWILLIVLQTIFN